MQDQLSVDSVANMSFPISCWRSAALVLPLVVSTCVGIAQIRSPEAGVGNRDSGVPQSPHVADFRASVEHIIARFEAIPVHTTDSPWRIFHRLHAGAGSKDFMLVAESGEPIAFRGWLTGALSGAPVHAGLPLVYLGAGRPQFTVSSPLRCQGFEAHPGQFLWILHSAGFDLGDTPVLSGEGARRFTLKDCALSLFEGVSGSSDVSWVLPLAAEMIANPYELWQTRFDEDMSLESMLELHLDHEASARYCLGMHWLLALMSTTRHYEKFSDVVRSRAKGRLRSRLVSLSEGQAYSPNLAENVPRSLDRHLSLLAQGHALEAIMTLDPSDRPDLKEPWLWSLAFRVATLCDELPDPVSDSEYGAFAHAVRALRLFALEAAVALEMSNGAKEAATSIMEDH